MAAGAAQTPSSLVASSGHGLLMLIALTLPWDAYQYIPGTEITLVKLAGVAVIALAALDSVRNRILPVRLHALRWPIVLLAAGAGLSTLVSLDTAASLYQLRIYMTYFLFLMAAAHFIRNADTAHLLLKAFSYSTCAAAVVTIACYWGALWPVLWGTASWPTQRLLLEFRDGVPMRMSGVVGDFNLAALYVLIALVYLLFGARRRAHAAPIHVVGAAVLLYALFITMSRSGLLLAGVVSFVWLLSQIPPKYRGLAACTAAAVVALAVILARDTAYIQVLLDRAGGGVVRDDGSIKGRMEVYRLAFSLLPRYGLLGCGLGASDTAIARLPAGIDVTMTIHSTPLKFMIETGIVGAVGLIWLIAAVLRTSWQQLAHRAAHDEGRLGRSLTGIVLTGFLLLCVQPFPMLSLYPFILALLIGPAAAKHRAPAIDGPPRGHGPAPLIAAAVITVLVIGIDVRAYQHAANLAIAYSDSVERGQRAIDEARWEDALAAYDQAHEQSAGAALDFAPYRRLAEALISYPTLMGEQGLPESPVSMTGLAADQTARVHLALGNLEACQAALDSGLTANWLEFALAEARWREGQFAQALEGFRRWNARTADGSSDWSGACRQHLLSQAESASLIVRATSLRRLGRWEEAVSGFDQVDPGQPGYGEALYNRAVGLLLIGQEAQALEGFREAFALGHLGAGAQLGR